MVEASLADLAAARAATRELIDPVAEEDLTRVVTPLLSPLLWDLGHIGNFEQRRLLGEGDGRLAAIFDPFANPRSVRGTLSIMGRDECFEYLDAVREQVIARIDRCDPFDVELVIQHELQHGETMLQLLRMLDGYRPPARDESASVADGTCVDVAADAWREWIEIGGRVDIGTTGAGGFAYDNEGEAHVVDLPKAGVARAPVTNAAFLEWLRHGGYERPEWWSASGWDWRKRSGVEAPLGWRVEPDGDVFERRLGGETRLEPTAPVIHVGWYEAEAFANAHGARLPTEFEWEAAAGLGAGVPGANLDRRHWGTRPVGLAGGGDAPLDMLGQAWEWTASEFTAYPGFTPFRYAEYSAPFFDRGFRVLRGGSWATMARTVSTRFRNWDLPERRQIFAGFRLAR